MRKSKNMFKICFRVTRTINRHIRNPNDGYPRQLSGSCPGVGTVEHHEQDRAMSVIGWHISIPHITPKYPARAPTRGSSRLCRRKYLQIWVKMYRGVNSVCHLKPCNTNDVYNQYIRRYIYIICIGMHITHYII